MASKAIAIQGVVSFKQDGSLNDIVKTVAELEGEHNVNVRVSPNAIKNMEAAFSTLNKNFSDTISKGASLGITKGFSNNSAFLAYRNELEKIHHKALESQNRIGSLQEMRDKTSDKNEKFRLDNQIRAEEKRIAILIKSYKKQGGLEDDVFKRRESAIKAQAELDNRTRRQVLEDAGEVASKITEAASSFQGLSFEGLAKGGGEVIQKLGSMMERKGGSTAANATDANTKAIGNLIAAAGPAIAAIGGMVAGIAAVVKVLIDADAQTKELNRSILSQASTADLMTGRADNLKKSLEGVRDAAVSWRNNMTWGTTAQEQIQILNAFNEAGFTFRQMAEQLEKGKKSMYAYQKATEAALVYSKLLGLSATEVATNMADMMEETGAGLKGIKDRFSAVYEAASLSGFSAKRFYGIVLEATSGMAMYNVRMEEAAGLLTKLGKILGKKVAPEFLKNITDMFKSDDIPTRFKKIMLAGQGNMKEIFAKSAQNIASDFLDKFKDIGGDLAKMGIKGFDKIKGADDLVAHLKKLKPEEQTKLIAKVNIHNAGMARQLENVVQISKGSTGKLGDMALHLDSLDLGGKMQYALTQASALFKKPIHELGAIQTAAFANATGMGMEQIKQLRRVSRRMDGNYKVLEAQKTEMGNLYKASLGSGETAKAAKARLAELLSQQHKQAASMGAMVQLTENGQAQIVAATVNSKDQLVKTTKEIKSQGDLVQSSGEAFKKAAKEGAPEHIQLARDTATQTRDMTHILKTGVQYFLEQINKHTSFIANWLPGGLSDTEKANKQVVTSQIQEQIKNTKSQQDVVAKQLGALEISLKNPKLGSGEKEKAQKEIAKLKDVAKALEFQKNQQSKSLDATRDISSGKWGWGRNLSTQEFQNQASQSAATGILTQQGLGGDLKKRQDAAILKENAQRQKEFDDTGYGSQVMSAKEEIKLRQKIAKQMLDEQNKKTQETINSYKFEADKSREQNKKIADKAPTATGDAIVKAQNRSQMMQLLASQMGKDSGLNMNSDSIRQYMSSGVATGPLKDLLGKQVTTGTGAFKRTQSVLDILKSGNGANVSLDASKMAPGLPKSEDFLLSITEGGKMSLINRFSSSDSLSVLGTKPGGAIASGVGAGQGAKGVGGAGGRPIINITIHGNEEKAYGVVKRALQTSGVI